jgi:hypothetical protein
MLQQKLEVMDGHDVAVIIFVLGKQLRGDNFVPLCRVLKRWYVMCMTAKLLNFACCPLFQKYNIMETSGTLNSIGCLKFEDVYECSVVRNEVSVIGVASKLQADQLRCYFILG